MHHGRELRLGNLAVALLRKTGTGRAALTWLRVSLLPQERLGLNGSFMGQWEASLLAGIPHTPPCPVWGPCCLAPFIVYPELASSGMWLLAVPPQVPATYPCELLLHTIFTEALMSPFSLRFSIIFVKFNPETDLWHCVAQICSDSCGETWSLAAVAPSWSHTPVDQAPDSPRTLTAASDFVCRAASYLMPLASLTFLA